MVERYLLFLMELSGAKKNASRSLSVHTTTMAERWARSFFRDIMEPEIRSRDSLPHPPQGMQWVLQDEDRQWKLVQQPPVEPKEEPARHETAAATVVAQQQKQPQLQQQQYLMDGLPPRCDSSSSKHSSKQLSSDHNTHTTNNNEWEWLSDRLSQASSAVMVPRDLNGVTRTNPSPSSIHKESSGMTVVCNGMKSVKWKLQRTNSNSTIDSADTVLGPSGKGILGVDYVEHVVLPTDTLPGICLSYKISTTQLKRANCFSGDSLSLAPKKLVIPISMSAKRSGFLRVQDTDQKEYKLHAFLAELPEISITEARGYFELADWDLIAAVASAKADDEDWNLTERAGDIHIVSGKGIVGAGIVKPTTTTTVVTNKNIPPSDMVHSAPEHAQIGVELKSVGMH